MARSSLRLGAKIPGVSTKTSCAAPSVAMPRRSARVVCTLCETIATLVPTSALISVDLPTLGTPSSAIKPQRVPASGSGRMPASSGGGGTCFLAIDPVRLDTLARQHGGGGGLLGGALGAPEPLRRRAIRQF